MLADDQSLVLPQFHEGLGGHLLKAPSAGVPSNRDHGFSPESLPDTRIQPQVVFLNADKDFFAFML